MYNKDKNIFDTLSYDNQVAILNTIENPSDLVSIAESNILRDELKEMILSFCSHNEYISERVARMLYNPRNESGEKIPLPNILYPKNQKYCMEINEYLSKSLFFDYVFVCYPNCFEHCGLKGLANHHKAAMQYLRKEINRCYIRHIFDSRIKELMSPLDDSYSTPSDFKFQHTIIFTLDSLYRMNNDDDLIKFMNFIKDIAIKYRYDPIISHIMSKIYDMTTSNAFCERYLRSKNKGILRSFILHAILCYYNDDIEENNDILLANLIDVILVSRDILHKPNSTLIRDIDICFNLLKEYKAKKRDKIAILLLFHSCKMEHIVTLLKKSNIKQGDYENILESMDIISKKCNPPKPISTKDLNNIKQIFDALPSLPRKNSNNIVQNRLKIIRNHTRNNNTFGRS